MNDLGLIRELLAIVDELGAVDWRKVPGGADNARLKEARIRACSSVVPTDPADEFVEVGGWLLNESYGDTYDHFTQTHTGTSPGHTIALFARRVDIDARSARRAAEYEATKAAVVPTDTETEPSEAEIESLRVHLDRAWAIDQNGALTGAQQVRLAQIVAWVTSWLRAARGVRVARTEEPQ